MINKKQSMVEIIGINQVWAFFILTLVVGLLISGAIYLAKLDIYGSAFGILMYLAYMLCPAIIAVILLAVFDGREGVLSLFQGLLRWKVGIQWYILAILLPVAIELLTTGIYLALAGKFPEGYSISLVPWNLALDILISSVGLALGLGFALPLLLKTYSPAVATAITALFMILYRAMSLINDKNAIVMCIGLVALAFLLVWIYNNARNSLVILTIFMFLYTLLSNSITYQLSLYSNTGTPVIINKALLIVGIAAFVIGFRYLSLDQP